MSTLKWQIPLKLKVENPLFGVIQKVYTPKMGVGFLKCEQKWIGREWCFLPKQSPFKDTNKSVQEKVLKLIQLCSMIDWYNNSQLLLVLF